MPTRSLGAIVFTFMKFAFGIGIQFELSTALKDNFRVLAAHNPPNPAPTMMTTRGGAARVRELEELAPNIDHNIEITSVSFN